MKTFNRVICLCLAWFLGMSRTDASLVGSGIPYDVTFYGVQTIFKNGSLSSGTTPPQFHLTGTSMLPQIDGMDTSPLYNWPMFMEIADKTFDDENYDGGTFLVSNNGYRLYYINEDAGYATVFLYAQPGNTNTVIARLIYSTDPSKANTGTTLDLYNSSGTGSYEGSDSSRSRSSASGSCGKCHGKGYSFERYQNATGDYYYNSAGSNCPICGYSDRHYHYKCYH